MVNIVKFAQLYCIYLLSSAQMSAVEMQIRCFYKKTICSMVVLSSGMGILYTVRIHDQSVGGVRTSYNFVFS